MRLDVQVIPPVRGTEEAQPSKRSRFSVAHARSPPVGDVEMSDAKTKQVPCPSFVQVVAPHSELSKNTGPTDLQSAQSVPIQWGMHANQDKQRLVANDVLHGRHIVKQGDLAQRLEAAKPVVYMAGGMLPQFPWKLQRGGVLLVVDLWSGFGGSVLALLALGAQVIVVSAENNGEVDLVAHTSMPNTVHVDDVEKIVGQDLIAVIQRRNISTVLIGGGAPCQGNSELAGPTRKGVKDPRTIGANHAARIERELRAAAAEVNVCLPPVGTWIENVASAPREAIDFYTRLIGANPILINAGQFGYVQRNRLFWGQIDGKVIGPEQLKGLVDVEMDWGHRTMGASTPKVLYKGKHFPKSVRLAGGYSFALDPEKICKQGGKGAMCAFSREFPHPDDRMSRSSQAAQKRFLTDGKRFPPGAYEDHSLAWKGSIWRTFTSCERAQMMGWPYEALQEGLFRARGDDWKEGERKRNSFVGNGFHAPSIMIFLALLLHVVEGARIPALLYPVNEENFRSRIHGTPWEPGFNVPGTLDGHSLLTEIRLQFDKVDFRQAKRPRMWERAKEDLRTVDLKSLQVYWMSAVSRGFNPLELAPEWRDQKHKAMHAASIGSQRATSQSTRGLHPLLPPGLGMESHMFEARKLSGALDGDPCLDDDLWFAATEMAIFGPHHNQRREYVLQQWKAVKEALSDIDSFLISRQPTAVHQIAQNAAPALVAAATALARWPDHTQGQRYVYGFPIVGPIEDTGVFRKLPEVQSEQEAQQELLGDYARECVQKIMKAEPSEEFSDEIWKLSLDEVQKGFAHPMCTAEELDALYGPGQWLPMERFMVRQASGKLRCIDNGKKYKHNKAAKMLETLFIVGLDFIPAVVKVILLVLLQMIAADDIDWVVYALEIGIIDLVDAYRYVPVLPEHARFSISSVWSPTQCKWVFLRLLGHAFGLAAAVQNFNRRPALLVAIARRTMGMAVASYFDDFGLIDFSGARGTGLDHLSLLIELFGAPQAPAKRMPMACMRVYLGQVAHVGAAVENQTVVMEPKPNAREESADELMSMAREDHVMPARASKVRGKIGWIASATYGRIGRFGTGVLKKIQYSNHSVTIGHEDRIALKLLAAMILQVPPRVIKLMHPRRPSMLVYSDASWEGEARLGWVMIEEDDAITPEGRTSLVTKELLDNLIERNTQIMACEAIVVPQAILREPERFAGKDVLWFIDNEAACSSLIRGNSSQEDIGVVSGVTHFLMLQYDIRIWFEWVDSKSNPSDGLSRDGLKCLWTLKQGWNIADSHSLTWQELASVVPLPLK